MSAAQTSGQHVQQTGQQMRAAATLAKILDRAAATGLPPIAWTVESTGAGLQGRPVSHPMGQRRDDFNAWRAAIREWMGQGPEREDDRTDSAGTARLVAQWAWFRFNGERAPGVLLTLAADIPPED